VEYHNQLMFCNLQRSLEVTNKNDINNGTKGLTCQKMDYEL